MNSFKRKQHLTEGTSNFWSQDNIPLYVGYWYDIWADESEDAAMEAYLEDRNLRRVIDWDDYYEFRDEYLENYPSPDLPLVPLEDGSEDDILRQANKKIEDKYDEFDDKWDKLNQIPEDELTPDEEKQLQYYGTQLDVLKEIKLVLKDGYYEGVQLYLEGIDYWVEDNISKDTLNFLNTVVKEAAKELGMEEASVAYRFSNGETGYTLHRSQKESRRFTEHYGLDKKWKVQYNPMVPDAPYVVYRIRDVDEVDCAGNREYGSDYMASKEDAQKIADRLNREDKVTETIKKNKSKRLK